MNLFATCHMFGREPATHTRCLEIRVKPVGELLIFCRVADKAGVELDGLANEGANVGNEVVGNAGATQENLWYFPFGFVNRIDGDNGWPQVVYILQSLRHTQIDIREYGPSDIRLAEIS